MPADPAHSPRSRPESLCSRLSEIRIQTWEVENLRCAGSVLLHRDHQQTLVSNTLAQERLAEVYRAHSIRPRAPRPPPLSVLSSLVIV